jgi:beta-galactosidase
MKKLFNDNWEFAKTDVASRTPPPTWQPVKIPHDWLIYDVKNLYETSCGWYRKRFTLDFSPKKSYRLYFDGVYMDCTVYVNNEFVMDWKYGYTAFEADISDFVKAGRNEVIVQVRHAAPNSRWYSGAGIYRNVWLYETEKTHFITDGLYFNAVKRGSAWDCTVSAEVAGADYDSVLFTAAGKTTAENNFSLKIPAAQIWSLEKPYLFDLTAQLMRRDEVIDEVSCKVGFREMRFTPDKGFFLNGKRVKMNGVCLHHDLGCLGAAFNKAAAKRQLLTMKEMGANAIRTAHNPPAKEFMELCDELGFLVNSEFTDIWELPMTEFDYSRFFTEWYEKDTASWIRRDRNHASLVMWSIGNEILDTHVNAHALEITKNLHAAVRKHDPLCNAPTTIGSNYMEWEPAQKCAMEVDLAGYNYGEHLYEVHHKKHPNWCIYGSETTSGTKSRGIYHFPLEREFLTHENLQCSSLGNCKSGFQKLHAEEVIVANRDIDCCAGMFIWTGADYLGEPTPYDTKNAYFGAIDTAGIKKDAFWLYKAAWSDASREAVLHIMPYWDFNAGQEIDIIVYTNLREAELFVNNRSLGKKTTDNYTLIWEKVPFEAGELTAVSGKHRASRKSFGDSEKIVLNPERIDDLITVEISTADKDGNPVENARDRINLDVKGGELLGFDNGDSSDYDSYKSSSRRLFSGKAVAYISAPPEAEVTFTAAIDKNDVPVRKIELIKEGEFNFKARIYPANASYCNLNWSVVTNSGVKSNCAAVKAHGDSAVLAITGDGEFRLRCTCNNGKPQADVVSEYEFYASGYGAPVIDPYSFTPACLGLSQFQEVSEGGLYINRAGESAAFENTDFGAGADEFELSAIHWHTNEPFTFKLYANEKLLGEFKHQADFVWMTYQPNTFKLSKKLTGIKNIVFEFEKTEKDIHFGGFKFK